MKLKKFASVLLALVITACMSVTVFAASGINDNESAILNELTQPVPNAAGAVRSIPQQYLNQATNYFDRDGVDVTAAQAETIIGYIESARARIAPTTAANAASLPQDVINGVVADAKAAAAVLGLTLTYNTSTGVVTIKDASGNIVLQTGALIQQTGFGLNAVWVVLAALVLLALAGYVLLAQRRRIAVAAR